MLARVLDRLREVGIDTGGDLAPTMLREQRALNEAELAEAASGKKVPHLLKSARRVGMLEPEILEALGLAEHRLIRGALRSAGAGAGAVGVG